MTDKDQITEMFAKLDDGLITPASHDAPQDGIKRPYTVASEALRFILAGKARVTFEGRKSRFTYQISRPKEDAYTGEKNPDMFFVALLTGPNNTEDYQYFGYIRRGIFFHARKKTRVSEDAPGAIAWKYTFGNLSRGVLPDGVKIWHEGRCGRCGLPLTVPESVASGFGPECIRKIGS